MSNCHWLKSFERSSVLMQAIAKRQLFDEVFMNVICYSFLCIWGWHTQIVTKQNIKCILFSTFKVNMKGDSKFVYWIFNGKNVRLLDFYASGIDWIGKSALYMTGSLIRGPWKEKSCDASYYILMKDKETTGILNHAQLDQNMY